MSTYCSAQPFITSRNPDQTFPYINQVTNLDYYNDFTPFGYTNCPKGQNYFAATVAVNDSTNKTYGQFYNLGICATDENDARNKMTNLNLKYVTYPACVHPAPSRAGPNCRWASFIANPLSPTDLLDLKATVVSLQTLDGKACDIMNT